MLEHVDNYYKSCINLWYKYNQCLRFSRFFIFSRNDTKELTTVPVDWLGLPLHLSSIRECPEGEGSKNLAGGSNRTEELADNTQSHLFEQVLTSKFRLP